jgi:hypothetical protein
MSGQLDKSGESDVVIRIGHFFCQTRHFKVLTGGMCDKGVTVFQNSEYVLDVISGDFGRLDQP